MTSPEIKNLINKYPDLQKGKNDLIDRNRAQLGNLYNKCNEFLINEPARQEIQR